MIVKLSNRNVYEKAQSFVDKWEGYVSNDKGDAGGLTKYGVSMKYLKSIGRRGDINGDGAVNEKDVMAVTKEDQRRLFKADFWDPLKLDEFPERLAFVTYDSAVNCGAKQTIKLLQRALGVADDGVLGPKTLDAVKRNSDDENDLKVALKMCDERDKFYKGIANKGSNGKFLKGWLNRVNDCRLAVTNFA